MIPVRLFFLILAASMVTEISLACDLAGVSRFEPTLAPWERHAGPAQRNPSAGGDYWEAVPAPNVDVAKVIRGSAAPGSSCDDAGLIRLNVSLPPSSTYDIAEFGVYFRVVRGELPDQIFPDIPVVGAVEGDKMVLALPWLDGHPRQQIALDIVLEVFLVTNGLNIGAGTRVMIVAPAGGG